MRFPANFCDMIKPALFFLVLAFGFSLWGCDGENPSRMGPPPTPEVAVITVQPQSVTLTTELPGRTAAFRMAEIRPQVSGLIKKRLFTEGTEVKAGQVLYQIDPAPFQAALDSAAANLSAMGKTVGRAKAILNASIADLKRQESLHELALSNSRRFEDLIKDRAVSALQRDQAATDAAAAEAALKVAEAQVESSRQSLAVAEAAVKQAEAAMKTARINLAYTQIAAPISGRIGRSNVTEGAIVTAYQPMALATIQQLDPIYVDVQQSTSDLLALKRRIKDGQINQKGPDQSKVRLILGEDTPYPQEGMFQFRDVTVDPSTGSVILRIVFPNAQGALLPGMFVRAVVKEGINEQAILVSQQGVFRDHKGNPAAFVVNDDDKVEQRPLTLERTIGHNWLVSAGLAAGDRVIVEGMQKVRPGSPVKVVPFNEGGVQPAASETTPQSTEKSK